MPARPALTALEKEARHLLDEQGHSAGPFADAIDDILRQSVARGDLPDHAPDLFPVERGERDDAVMRPHSPGRSELGSRGRNDKQRRLSATFGERVHEIERGRIGPVQVLERQDNRLGPCARENPGRHRRQLSASQLLRT